MIELIDKKILKTIENKINKDIENEINFIKNEIDFFLNKDLNMYFLKEFSKYYTLKLLKEKSTLLLDTLLNYLMEEILKKVKNFNYETQYIFLKEDIRNKIRNWSTSQNQKFSPALLKLEEEESIIEKGFFIILIIVVSIGGIITASVIPQNFLLKLIPAIFSLGSLIYIYIHFKQRGKRIKGKWKKQIDSYLKKSQKELKAWLTKAKEKFLNELKIFYEKMATLEYQNKSDQEEKMDYYLKIQN